MRAISISPPRISGVSVTARARARCVRGYTEYIYIYTVNVRPFARGRWEISARDAGIHHARSLSRFPSSTSSRYTRLARPRAPDTRMHLHNREGDAATDGISLSSPSLPSSVPIPTVAKTVLLHVDTYERRITAGRHARESSSPIAPRTILIAMFFFPFLYLRAARFTLLLFSPRAILYRILLFATLFHYASLSFLFLFFYSTAFYCTPCCA